MPQTLTRIATISLILISAAFYFVGILRYFVFRLPENNSVGAYGTLVGFRKYYNNSDQIGDHSLDYSENKPGRVPIIKIRVDGEDLDIAASAANYKLTREDLGKRFKIRYRRFIGITLVIDDGQSLKNYNQLQTILAWAFISVATILLALGLLANSVLPKILSGATL
jgi:hypothetical protein